MYICIYICLVNISLFCLCMSKTGIKSKQICIYIYIYIYIYTDYECFLYQYHTCINKSRRHFLQVSNISILTNLHIYIHLRKALE